MTAVGIHAHPLMKLGKARPRHDPRTFKLARYLTTTLPKTPRDRDWLARLGPDLGMMANDRYGDCGFAALGHAKQTWTGARGLPIVPTDDQILSWYAECTGFNPDDPTTDNGVVLLDALNYFRKKGLITAFISVDHANLAHVKAAIDIFGGVYTGAGLPISAQNQDVWTAPPHDPAHPLTGDDEPYSLGGHAMWSGTFTARSFTYATWGARKRAMIDWWQTYCDECFVVLGPEWSDVNLRAPNGFDLDTLRSDLAALA